MTGPQQPCLRGRRSGDPLLDRADPYPAMLCSFLPSDRRANGLPDNTACEMGAVDVSNRSCRGRPRTAQQCNTSPRLGPVVGLESYIVARVGIGVATPAKETRFVTLNITLGARWMMAQRL